MSQYVPQYILYREPLVCCMEASPVNKKLMAYYLRQKIGGGSSYWGERNSGIKSDTGRRFALNSRRQTHEREVR